jgi:hypothetical protein
LTPVVSTRTMQLAVRGALAAGAVDGRAVAVLARRTTQPTALPLAGLDARLAAHDRPTRTCPATTR